jgi:hypothetical protein
MTRKYIAIITTLIALTAPAFAHDSCDLEGLAPKIKQLLHDLELSKEHRDKDLELIKEMLEIGSQDFESDPIADLLNK